MALRRLFPSHDSDMNVRVLSLLIGIVIAQALTGCDGKQPSATDGVKIDPPKQRFVIVCTTMINTEMAQLLAGDLTNPQVEIRGLMQRGDDPHSYVIRPADLQSLREADLVLMNGLELEATLESLIDEHAKDAVIVRLGEATGVNHISGEGGKPDPHVWMSPANYGAMLDRAADALARVVTRHGAAIRKRAAAHQSQVTELHKWVQEKAAALPADRRTLLASDDGLTYLGNLLGVKIVHLAIDPDAQPTQADRDALFVVPPGRKLWGFRLFSRRAQVFDVKSIPYAPAGMEEWWRR